MITAKIVEVKTDENGNVKVSTEYSVDGKVIQTGSTRYSASQSLLKDDIIARIDADINQHCENLISRAFVATKNIGLVTDLSSVINKTYSAETGKVVVGANELTVNETSVVSSKPKATEVI